MKAYLDPDGKEIFPIREGFFKGIVTSSREETNEAYGFIYWVLTVQTDNEQLEIAVNLFDIDGFCPCERKSLIGKTVAFHAAFFEGRRYGSCDALKVCENISEEKI